MEYRCRLGTAGGELIDGVHMVDGSAMTPAAAGSHAYVLTNGGRLLSLQVADPHGGVRPNRMPIY